MHSLIRPTKKKQGIKLKILDNNVIYMYRTQNTLGHKATSHNIFNKKLCTK